jgi:hypothetical protein
MERRSSPPFRISVVLPLNFLQFLFATNKHLFLAAFNFEHAWLAPRCASTDFRLPTRVFKLGLRASPEEISTSSHGTNAKSPGRLTRKVMKQLTYTEGLQVLCDAIQL